MRCSSLVLPPATNEKAFELCTSVSGIGPKLAIGLLSGLDAAGLFAAVAAEDVARLRKVPWHWPQNRGTPGASSCATKCHGPKAEANRSPGKQDPAAVHVGLFADVMGALVNLGYRPTDAERATEQTIKAQPGSPDRNRGAHGAASVAA